MAFWNIDLTTRMGAHSATWQGAIACFIFAGLALLGAVVFGASIGIDTPEGIGGLIGVGIEILVALIAGLRMRVGKGAYWGMAAAFLLTIEIIAKIVAITQVPTGIPGLVINVVILVVIINGVRAALALKTGTGFEDDIHEVFE